MIKIMREKVLFFTMSLIVIACGNPKEQSEQVDSLKIHQPDSNALRLNNKAARLIGDAGHSYDSLKGLLYDSAIVYLNQAIEIDSLYLLAYTNKAQALQRKGSLEQALEVLHKMETIKPNLAEAIMGQGLILEKMGNMELANKKYRQALEAYEKRVKDDPKNIRAQSDIAFLYVFLEDKNKAIDEIHNLVLENPTNDELKAIEGLIENFDRKKFIEEY